jgi:hypothetical protein
VLMVISGVQLRYPAKEARHIFRNTDNHFRGAI